MRVGGSLPRAPRDRRAARLRAVARRLAAPALARGRRALPAGRARARADRGRGRGRARELVREGVADGRDPRGGGGLAGADGRAGARAVELAGRGARARRLEVGVAARPRRARAGPVGARVARAHGRPARCAIQLKKGGVVCLRFRGAPAAGRAELRWSASPKILASSGASCSSGDGCGFVRERERRALAEPAAPDLELAYRAAARPRRARASRRAASRLARA